MRDTAVFLLAAHRSLYLFIPCCLWAYTTFPDQVWCWSLGAQGVSEQERGESGAGYGGASLCGTSGPPTQSPPCPSSVPHTKAPFSGGPELISAFFPLPHMPPSQLLQYLHRDDNPLPSRCWPRSHILGAALTAGSTLPTRVSAWGQH